MPQDPTVRARQQYASSRSSALRPLCLVALAVAAACSPQHATDPTPAVQPHEENGDRFSKSFASVRCGVTRTPTVVDLEAILFEMKEGASPAAAAAKVFADTMSWKSDAVGAVWGQDGWSAASLEIPNSAQPIAPGRVIAGESASSQWLGSGVDDLLVWPLGEEGPDPRLYSLARARKAHWLMARDPVEGFVDLMATAAPLDPALPARWSEPSSAATSWLDQVSLLDMDFTGNRGRRAQALTATTRSGIRRRLWAAWWGSPDAPFHQVLAGWSEDQKWPLATDASPTEVRSFYGP